MVINGNTRNNLNTRLKNHFSCQADWTVEFSSLEVFKPKFPGCLPADLAVAGISVDFGADNLQRSLLGSAILCLCDTVLSPSMHHPKEISCNECILLITLNPPAPPSKKNPQNKDGAVTFHVIKITSLMEALRVLNRKLWPLLPLIRISWI